MKVIIGALAIAAINCIHVEVEHESPDYSSIPDWKAVCNHFGNNICGLIQEDCCHARCNKKNLFKHVC